MRACVRVLCVMRCQLLFSRTTDTNIVHLISFQGAIYDINVTVYMWRKTGQRKREIVDASLHICMGTYKILLVAQRDARVVFCALAIARTDGFVYVFLVRGTYECGEGGERRNGSLRATLKKI